MMSEKWTPLFTADELKVMLERAEMAASVTIPIERFRDLVYQVMKALDGQA